MEKEYYFIKKIDKKTNKKNIKNFFMEILAFYLALAVALFVLFTVEDYTPFYYFIGFTIVAWNFKRMWDGR
jgi:hypothetical protein